MGRAGDNISLVKSRWKRKPIGKLFPPTNADMSSVIRCIAS